MISPVDPERVIPFYSSLECETVEERDATTGEVVLTDRWEDVLDGDGNPVVEEKPGPDGALLKVPVRRQVPRTQLAPHEGATMFETRVLTDRQMAFIQDLQSGQRLVPGLGLLQQADGTLNYWLCKLGLKGVKNWAGQWRFEKCHCEPRRQVPTDETLDSIPAIVRQEIAAHVASIAMMTEEQLGKFSTRYTSPTATTSKPTAEPVATPS